MATRQMTAKLFARAAIGNSPEAFLNKHMEWLRSHNFLSPILDAFEVGDVEPTHCIGALREALIHHDIQSQFTKAKFKFEEALKRTNDAAYTITIYTKFFNTETNEWDLQVGTNTKKHIVEDEAGNKQVITEEEDMVFTARMYHMAERIAVLKLSRREDGLFALIDNNFGGKKITTKITRDQALGMMFPKDKSPFMKRTSSNQSKPLKNYMRSHNDRAVFSGC